MEASVICNIFFWEDLSSKIAFKESFEYMNKEKEVLGK